jgi:hypothetical protein
MVSHTRRRLLQAATAVAGGVAGCSRFTGETGQSTRTASSGGPDALPSDAETEPPSVLLRADTELPPVRPAETDRRSGDASRHEHGFSHGRDVLDSRSSGRALTVADDVDGEAVSSFVSGTDFDDETLYLESIRVEECFRLRLCYVSWQSDEVETDYVRELRPYDERCGTDERVFESRLVRLPVALDEDAVNSYRSSISGSGRCNHERGADGEDSSMRDSSTGTRTRTTEEGEQ